MRRVIVNADDFGRHVKINEAVALGAEKGFLRSATLMPGGAAFEDAVGVARAHAALGVGVHFTLVNGNPILPAAEIPSLVAENGLFYEDYTLFVKRFLLGRVRLEEVRRELAAQMAKMQRTGLRFTHIDSHQHMHTLPGIIGIALDIAAAAGIHAVRVPETAVFYRGGYSDSLGSLIGRAGLSTLAHLARLQARRRGFQMPEHFAGIVAGEAVTEAHMHALLAGLTEGTMEVMLHPGTENGVLQADCLWQHDFEAELAAVTSLENQQLMKERGIEAGNFGDLIHG